MLHQQDSSLLLVGPTQQDEAYRGKVFKMDLERGKVVEEWVREKVILIAI
jgi:hypothetical protein